MAVLLYLLTKCSLLKPVRNNSDLYSVC